MDRALGAVQLLGNLVAAIFLEPQPSHFPEILGGKGVEQSLKLFGHHDGELRTWLGADNQIQLRILLDGCDLALIPTFPGPTAFERVLPTSLLIGFSRGEHDQDLPQIITVLELGKTLRRLAEAVKGG